MLKDKISKETVRERLKYPYEIKVKMTERRLSEFITYYGESGVVVSISGGLDSTAAMHFIHKRYPDVEAICVLGIECRDNIEMVMKIRDEWGVNVNIAKPRKSQQAVLKEFGYPIVSKRAAKSLNHLQNPTEKNANSRRLALTGITNEGRYAKTWVLAKKWRFLIKAPFKISNKCCYYMKETPVQNWTKENGKASIVATLVEESQSRLNGYCKRGGCNSFDGQGESTPFSFWTRQDILRYLYENNVEISKAYGRIEQDEDGNKADMKNDGVKVIKETDGLIIRAITLYCKAEFGFNNAAEQFRKSYDALKMRLSLSVEYNTAPQVSETDTDSAESGV